MHAPISLIFAGLQKKVQFMPYAHPSWKDQSISFPQIPNIDRDELGLVLSRRPFVNNVAERIRLSNEESLLWGIEVEWRCPLVYTAYIGSGAERRLYCVKIAMHTTKLADPTGDSQDAINKMIADARFHVEQLQPVEGILVPTHYGLWRTKTTWGGEMLCAITEFGGTPWNLLRKTSHDTERNRIAIARTIEGLHEFEIEHNQLWSISDMRHILLAPSADGNVTCFIVDFSQATRTICPRTLPMLPLDESFLTVNVGCKEASNVMCMLDMYSENPNPNPDSLARRALAFFSAYATRFPTIGHDTILIAQRHLFFNDSPLLEEVKFGFRDDGSMVYWTEDEESEPPSNECANLASKLSDSYLQSLIQSMTARDQ